MTSKKTIEKWNNYFNSLSTEEKRVAIAKDVLAQIKDKRLIPMSMIYFVINTTLDESSSIQANLNKVTCHACALGSLMFSHIKYNNKVTVREGSSICNNNSISERLKDYFDRTQLNLIETAFEKWFTDESNTTDEIIASKYCNNSENSEQRIIKIMKNLIRNKGTFVPTDKINI